MHNTRGNHLFEQTTPPLHSLPPSTTQSPLPQLCLELLITVALRNRDRVTLIWPLVHEVLAAATSASQESNALVERAVLGLLRVGGLSGVRGWGRWIGGKKGGGGVKAVLLDAAAW